MVQIDNKKMWESILGFKLEMDEAKKLSKSRPLYAAISFMSMAFKKGLKDQGLKFDGKEIICIEPDLKIEKGKWYVCIKNNVGMTQGNVYYGISDGYIIDDNGRKYNCNNWAVFQRYLRLWDIIQDAKNGDVLANWNNTIFIFKWENL